MVQVIQIQWLPPSAESGISIAFLVHQYRECHRSSAEQLVRAILPILLNPIDVVGRKNPSCLVNQDSILHVETARLSLGRNHLTAFLTASFIDVGGRIHERHFIISRGSS
jgi:hypothetical protein